MVKFWIQAFKADHWETLYEGTSPANLLVQFTKGLNNNLREFQGRYGKAMPFRICERETSPAVCHQCSREYKEEFYHGQRGCALCCPKCRGDV